MTVIDNAPVPLDPSLRSSKDSAGGRQKESVNDLYERALSGSSEDVYLLAERVKRAEAEHAGLNRQLKKQELDFSTLFEIVGQTSARSLDLDSMQTYLMRTVSGHFTTPQLMILRKQRDEDQELIKTAHQGMRKVELSIPLKASLCATALQQELGMRIKDLPEGLASTPEVVALRKIGIELAVPLIQEVETPDPVLEGFLLLGTRLANRAYDKADLEFLNTLGKMLAICLRNEALYRRSIVDDLTGVASRGHFEARLSQEINRVEIYSHRSLGLVMIDLDRFKGINDTYGHQTGDRVLQSLADTLEKQVRNVDLVARYGGEEFAVVLLEIERKGAYEVAKRLRQAIEQIEIKSLDGQPLKITASLGVACYPDDAADKTELIQITDKALYEAKDTGRNRVILAPTREDARKTAAERRKKETEAMGLPSDRRKPSGRFRVGTSQKSKT